MTEPSKGERAKAKLVAATADPLTKGERSKAKLVAATADLLRRQGYHATGLAQIVAASGAPRGSLYFYFPGGKDELAIAAIEAAGAEWRARIEATIATAADVGTAIDRIITLLADDLEASDFEHGCPVAAVALEAASPPVRAAIAAHYRAWELAIADRITGFGVPAQVAPQVALAALAMVEGALLLAKVARSRAPLVTAGHSLRAMTALFAAPSAPPARRRARRPARSA